jgi:isopenicillin-N N-acyltransferase-like protein
VSASTVITVLCAGSGTPQAASIEISPAGVGVVPAPAGGRLLHTNHFLWPELAAGEILDPASTTHPRYRHLARTAGGGAVQVPADVDLPAVARWLCGSGDERPPICMVEDPAQSPAHRWSTLLTVLLDPVAFQMQYYPGPPDQAAARAANRF